MSAADGYNYLAHWDAEEGEYRAQVSEFPSLSHFAQSALAAERGMRRLVADILKEMHAAGEAPPVPLSFR